MWCMSLNQGALEPLSRGSEFGQERVKFVSESPALKGMHLP